MPQHVVPASSVTIFRSRQEAVILREVILVTTLYRCTGNTAFSAVACHVKLIWNSIDAWRSCICRVTAIYPPPIRNIFFQQSFPDIVFWLFYVSVSALRSLLYRPRDIFLLFRPL